MSVISFIPCYYLNKKNIFRQILKLLTAWPWFFCKWNDLPKLGCLKQNRIILRFQWNPHHSSQRKTLNTPPKKKRRVWFIRSPSKFQTPHFWWPWPEKQQPNKGMKKCPCGNHVRHTSKKGAFNRCDFWFKSPKEARPLTGHTIYRVKGVDFLPQTFGGKGRSL